MSLSLTSGIGHGRPGLRSGLPCFSDLLDDAYGQKVAAIEIRPSRVMTGWAHVGSGCYSTPCDEVHDYRTLDVAAVKTDLESFLTRVDSIAECQATASTFYYSSEMVRLPGFRWDLTNWDDGKYWDQFPILYIHLASDDNPNLRTVAVQFSAFVSSLAMVQPVLGPEKLANAGLDTWTTGTDCASWTENGVAAGKLVEQDATISKFGSSARLTMSAATGSVGLSQQAVASSSQGWYVAAGYYMSDVAGDPEIVPALKVTVGANIVGSDGRTYEAAALSLGRTYGVWKRFSLAFWCGVDGSTITMDVQALNTGGSAKSGVVRFDSLTFRRAHAHVYYGNRFTMDNLTHESGSNDIYFGGKRIGSAAVTIANADGLFDRALHSLNWLNAEVIVREGGACADGTDIPWDDWRQRFTGLIQAFKADDESIDIQAADLFAFYHVGIPQAIYSDIAFPNMDMSNVGASRPLLFGVASGITPPRIDKEATYGKYGVYEIAHCETAPNGIKAVDAVYAYRDSDAAAKSDSTKRLALTVTTHYTEDLATGRVSIVTDVGPYQITAENKELNFNTGGSELKAALTPGLYTADGLAGQIQAAMRTAVGGADTTCQCTYSNTTNKFTIGRTSGTLNLLCKTGTSKIQVWELIGFGKSDDRTGSTSYLGDDPTFEDPEKSHIIRVDAQGYKDTAGGKYTGSASALIETGPDICAIIFEKWLGRPWSLVDVVSFADARLRAPEQLGLYLKAPVSTKDIFERLEYTCTANIVLGGDGSIYFKVYSGAVPAGTPTLRDDDIVSGWQIEKGLTDVYTSVVVKYGEHPSTGAWMARQADEPNVKVQFGRHDQREFETYLTNSNNAVGLATRLLTLASRPPRKIMLSTRGKLSDSEVGDKVCIYRRRAVDLDGRFAGQLFRIVSIKKSIATSQIDVELVDDVATIANITCVAVCQAICMIVEQIAGCNESCEALCQSGCEATTQGCGITVCMETCQATCQGCGQTTCQTTCETSTQGCDPYCQAYCQTCGQGGGPCQGTCEVACQGCGQTTCQYTCQLACQSCGQAAGPCQSACQLACQVCGQAAGPCQTACEAAPACESGYCQMVCQGDQCQDVCQYPVEYGF
jgi:hypothetical protein